MRLEHTRRSLHSHCRFCSRIRHIHTSSSLSPLSCPSNAFGNQPYVRKSTLISPVWPSVTSTPSASRASRCRCAPSVPGPRELIAPEEPITLCQGTGGSMPGDSHFRAGTHPRSVRSYERSDPFLGMLTLPNVTRIGRLADKLRDMSY